MMEREERKRLKNLGKEIARRRSEELQASLARTNPAAFGSDAYIQNEIAIRRKERAARFVADAAWPVSQAERNFVLHRMDFDPAAPPSSPTDFWRCTRCQMLLASDPATSLVCACRNVFIEPVQYSRWPNEDGSIRRISGFRLLEPDHVEYVRLLGAVKRPWWRFWSWMV